MQTVNQKNELKIGELAAETGLNPKTIRFYESIGVLPTPKRNPSGYRLYNAADCERLRFIGKAKSFGMSLEEISEVLTIQRNGEQPCDHVIELIDQKISFISSQLQVLTEFQQELLGLRNTAGKAKTAEGCICGIIEHAREMK